MAVGIRRLAESAASGEDGGEQRTQKGADERGHDRDETDEGASPRTNLSFDAGRRARQLALLGREALAELVGPLLDLCEAGTLPCILIGGLYGHGVSVTTAIVPDGWRERLVSLRVRRPALLVVGASSLTI